MTKGPQYSWARRPGGVMPILGLAGMRLMSFVAACTVPKLVICGQNSVDNMLMFWLSPNSACVASRPPLFLMLPTPPAVSRLGGERLAGDTAGTAVPNRPQGCSTPGNIILGSKAGGGGGGGLSKVCGCWWEVATACLCITCSYFCWVFPPPPSFIKLFLSHPRHSLLMFALLIFFPPCLWGERGRVGE